MSEMPRIRAWIRLLVMLQSQKDHILRRRYAEGFARSGQTGSKKAHLHDFGLKKRPKVTATENILLSLMKRRLSGDITTLYNLLKGVCSQVGVNHTIRNCPKLQLRFRLDIREKVLHWKDGQSLEQGSGGITTPGSVQKICGCGFTVDSAVLN